MSGTSDDLKGRAKEAAGDLTDDDRLKREGKTDRAAGTMKDKAEDAKDWIEDKIDDVKDKAKRD
ncbi:MAG: CsbD family protein [Acidimicrobiales bacterium]